MKKKVKPISRDLPKRAKDILKAIWEFSPTDLTELKRRLELKSTGSLPYNLNKLKKLGLIKIAEEEPEEHGVVRKYYELTPEGRSTAEEMLGRKSRTDMRLESFTEEKLELKDLEHFLWKSADILRGAVEAPNYKHYILPLLFYKRLSELYEDEHERLMEEYGDEELAREAHTFNIPEGCLWSDLRKESGNLGETLNENLEAIARENPELDGVINRTDYNVPDELPPEKRFKLVEKFSTLRLGKKNADPDVFGRAYEYLIRQFALKEARKGGEFYTPREIVKVLVRILDPSEGDEIYDPCCGSVGMLIYSSYYLKEKTQDPRKLLLYGQELHPFTCGIAKMNVFLHDMDADIRQGDTLADSKFLEDGGLKKFNIAMANPMWNQDGYRNIMEEDKFERFEFGAAPNNTADWGWIQHMFASLKPGGRMGIVLDRGALFRGKSEGKIRKKFVENDWIECVIATPEKIFYNVTAPGCLLILNKNKPEERKGNVLFIHAEESYGEHDELKRMNQLREEDIEKIVNAYKEFQDVPKFASVIPIERVRDYDYNLNVSLYIDIFEEEEPVDIPQVLDELKNLDSERRKTEDELGKYLEELGYE